MRSGVGRNAGGKLQHGLSESTRGGATLLSAPPVRGDLCGVSGLRRDVNTSLENQRASHAIDSSPKPRRRPAARFPYKIFARRPLQRARRRCQYTLARPLDRQFAVDIAHDLVVTDDHQAQRHIPELAAWRRPRVKPERCDAPRFRWFARLVQEFSQRILEPFERGGCVRPTDFPLQIDQTSSNDCQGRDGRTSIPNWGLPSDPIYTARPTPTRDSAASAAQ
jgi:hypothetical protein